MQLCHMSPSYDHQIVLALPLNQTRSPRHGPQSPSSHLPRYHWPSLPPCLPFSLSWMQTARSPMAERGGGAASRTRTTTTICRMPPRAVVRVTTTTTSCILCRPVLRRPLLPHPHSHLLLGHPSPFRSHCSLIHHIRLGSEKGGELSRSSNGSDPPSWESRPWRSRRHSRSLLATTSAASPSPPPAATYGSPSSPSFSLLLFISYSSVLYHPC
jgi:hypothetical protein